MLKQKGKGSVLQDTDFSNIGNAFKFDGISLVAGPDKSNKKKKTQKKTTNNKSAPPKQKKPPKRGPIINEPHDMD